MIATKRAPLTDKQKKILDYIRDYHAKNRRPPTIRLIMAQFGLSSPNGAICHIASLEKKGYLTRDRFSARGIMLTDWTPPEDAVLAEREACAKLLEEKSVHLEVDGQGDSCLLMMEMAAKIRERGKA